MFAADPDPFHHVRDSQVWELPKFLLDMLGRDGHITLPLFLTKYMVLQLVAGISVLLIFRGLSKRISGGRTAKGGWWNFWEMLALFVRDEIVRPLVGVPHHHGNDHHGHDDRHGSEGDHATDVGRHESSGDSHAVGAHVAVDIAHPADKYLPYVWTVFFYVLICNLLGAIPWMGSPTANINVTGVLALVTFAHVVFYGSQVSGVGAFVKNLAPAIDMPGPLGVGMNLFIWCIEAVGFLIKHGVLAIRLFANIMAGHTVLGIFLSFIEATSGNLPVWGIVMPASILAQIGIGMLELFFGFLQAYVFALLTSLFISAAVNPH